MLKKIVSLTLTLVLAAVLFNVPALAADKPSSWAEEQVNAAIAAKLVPQSLQSKYTQATTRAEFCALAVALYETVKGKAIAERKTFDDTKDVNVEKMAGIGVVSGTGGNKFSPDAWLPREQAATLLTHLTDAVGKPLPKQAYAFADDGSISAWAKEAVGQVQAAGIMNGTGGNRFSPKDPFTREQSIIAILRTFNAIKGANSGSYFNAPQGSAKFLEGKSLLVSIFVSFGDSDWNSRDLSYVGNKLEIAEKYLEGEGKKYGKTVDLICDFDNNPDLCYNMTYSGQFYEAFPGVYNEDDNRLYEATNRAINNFIENSIPYLRLADKYQTDSIGYVVILKKAAKHCYAINYRLDQSDDRYHEKAVIFDAVNGAPANWAHEILHIFGATDYYIESEYTGVSKELVEYVGRNFSNDIMRTVSDSSGLPAYDRITNEISRLTAYCLGWVQDIPELKQFPEFKRNIPATTTDQSGQRVSHMENKSLTDAQLAAAVRSGEIAGHVGWLHLNGNQIGDISPLSSLTRLQILALSNNKIIVLTPLKSLTGLTWLGLSDNQISDITPLSSLTGLTELTLSGNQIGDITPLKPLTKLTGLYLGDNLIGDVTPLKSLVNLRTLYLHSNQIDDITPLSSLTGLETLYLHNNQINDITPLKALTNLKALSLTSNRISDITPLKSLTNLKELWIGGNSLPQAKIDELRAALPNCTIYL